MTIKVGLVVALAAFAQLRKQEEEGEEK